MKTINKNDRQALQTSLSGEARGAVYTKPEVEVIELETAGTLMQGSVRGDSIADPGKSSSGGGGLSDWDDPWGK